MHALDVLGDPTRRRILELLREGECCAGDVVDVLKRELGISQPGVSQHLRVLRDHGFVHVRADAQRRVYSLAPARLAEAGAWIEGFRSFWEQRLDALATEIARGKRRPAPGRRPAARRAGAA